MPKRPIHPLIPLLTLISGLAVAAWAGTGSEELGQPSEVISMSSLHMLGCESFELVGLVQVVLDEAGWDRTVQSAIVFDIEGSELKLGISKA